MSSRREYGDLLAGVWPTATPPARDDIRDELEDHLACSADEFANTGLNPQQANERARAAFGDVETVARRLYWLHHGRKIMAQRFMLGGLAGICAVLAVVLFITYRQSAETAGAVASLQTVLEQTDSVEVPVRIVLTGADGMPLAGREVYVWPRRIEEPPFALPNTSMLWQLGRQNNESKVRVTLPAAYELLVTDADGVVNLGRRPVGVYTAAVNLEPELLAGRWVDEQARRLMRSENRVVHSSWVGFAQQTFDVRLGRGPLAVAVRLPVLQRTIVRWLAPPGINGFADGNGLWLAIRGGGDDITVWLRGFECAPPFVEGVSQLDLPLPPRATLYAGYRIWREDRGNIPAVTQVDLPTPMTGEPPKVQLTAPRTREEMQQQMTNPSNVGQVAKLACCS